jgi:hypothetical protein
MKRWLTLGYSGYHAITYTCNAGSDPVHASLLVDHSFSSRRLYVLASRFLEK